MHSTIASALLCSVLFATGLAHAATWYVSPTGSGSTCTTGSPCSFATGRTNAQTGDKVIFKDGTYTTSHITYPITTLRSGVTFEAENKYTSGSHAILRPTTAVGHIINILHGGTVIRGLELDGNQTSGTSTSLIVMRGSGSGVIIEHNWIHHSAKAGIEIGTVNIDTDQTNITIRHNLIEDTGWAGPGEAVYMGSDNGVTVGATVADSFIYGNTLRRYTQQAVDLKPNSTNIDVHHNIMEFQLYRTNAEKADTESGVISRNLNHKFRDNILRHLCRVSNAVFWTDATSGHQIHHNVVYDYGVMAQIGDLPCNALNAIDDRASGPGGTAAEFHNNTFCTGASYGNGCATCNVHDNMGLPGGVPLSTCTSVENRILSEMASLPGLNYAGTDTIPPAAPTDVQVTSLYPTQIQVTWIASGSGDVAGYQIEYCSAPSCTPGQTLATGNIVSPYLYTQAVPATTYRITVKAIDTSDNLSTASTPTAETQTPATGLIAHWDLNQGTGTTATDVTPNTHDGTLCNGATCPQQGPTWIAGHIGSNALAFDGVNDFVRVTDNAALDFLAAQDFTIAMWVRSSQAAALDTWPALLNKVAATPDDGIDIGLHDSNTGTWYGSVWVNGVWFPVGNRAGNTCTNIATGAWRHIAFKRQGTTLSVYQDGALCDSLTDPAIDDTLANAIDLRLGIWATETIEEYAGDLDDVRIYNYALPPEEIGALASVVSTLALTHFRFGSPGKAEGALAWVADEDLGRKLRVDGSIRLRVQLQATGAASTQAFPLQCRQVPSSYQTISASCFSLGVCLTPDTAVTHGAQTTARQLTLPGGMTYVAGAYVTTPAWPTITLAASQVSELEYALTTMGITPGTVLCCRPVKGDGAPLDDYSALPDGAACVTVHPGSASLYGG